MPKQWKSWCLKKLKIIYTWGDENLLEAACNISEFACGRILKRDPVMVAFPEILLADLRYDDLLLKNKKKNKKCQQFKCHYLKTIKQS